MSNQNQTLPASPAPSVTPTAAPTAIITSTIGSEITACSTFIQEDSPGQIKTQIQTDAGKTGDVAGPAGVNWSDWSHTACV